MGNPAEAPKRYFIVSSMDIHPSAVRIGSIIHNLNRPDKPLSTFTPVVLEDAEKAKLASEVNDGDDSQDTDKKLVADTSLTVTTSKNTVGDFRRSGGWGVGVFATFLKQLVQTAKLSISRAKGSQFWFSAHEITTSRFAPSPSYYVRAAVADPEVSRMLRSPHERVYLITSVKVARQLTLVRIEAGKGGVDGVLGIDVPQIDSTIGIKGYHEGASGSFFREEYPGPIVFAFEVEQIRVTRKGEIERIDSDKLKGTILGRAEGEGGGEQHLDIVAENAVDEDMLDLFDLDCVAGTTDEDGEPCGIYLGSGY